MSEKLANNAVSTLSAGIDGAVTSLTVASAALFPTSGDFRIICGSEIMKVTAVAGATFTVLRGQEGTSPASHAINAQVALILTKEGLIAFRGDLITVGTFAALPAPGDTGRLYFTTDSHFLMRDNGSAWVPAGVLHVLTTPSDAGFSWINQGGATIDSSRGVLTLAAPAGSTKDGHLRVKNQPAKPYTVTVLLKGVAAPISAWNFGIVWRESGSGKYVAFQWTHTGGAITFDLSKFNGPGSFLNSYESYPIQGVAGGFDVWLRIADDGTNRIASFSTDGVNFQMFHTISNTDFITANQIGFYANSENSRPVTVTILSWKEE